MATLTSPSPIAISIPTDPISADVQAICGALTAISTAASEGAKFLQSPQGQKLVEAALNGEAQAAAGLAKAGLAVQGAFKDIGGWLEGLFKGKL